MSVLDPDRWQVVSPHLDRALDMAEDERAEWLAALRRDDPALAADLEALLAEGGAISNERFLEKSVLSLPEPLSLAGHRVGAYTLVSRIAQGGMGSVWLAERSDGRFTGQAAVKLLNASLVGREEEERFRREGSILARLTHPHIARLMDAGVSEFGHPYLVLEHVAGEPIDRYCDARKLAIEARLRLFLDVLEAVEHAHANLIVHRDIKPSNVFVSADGRVKLLDFGIAKLLDEEAGSGRSSRALARQSGVALTPDFAAPEQVTGDRPITAVTDVYALGTLLYVLLTGQHPLGALLTSPADRIIAIARAEPRRLSDAMTASKERTAEALAQAAANRSGTPDGLQGMFRGDLDRILARTLRKTPEERYPSVRALADDLESYLQKQPGARPETLGDRAARLPRGRAGAWAAAGALLCAALAAYAIRLAAERDQARLEAAQALVELARSYSEQGFDDRAEPLLREALELRKRALPAGDDRIRAVESLLAETLRRRDARRGVTSPPGAGARPPERSSLYPTQP
jgi:serine/threonine protein kinase